MRVSIIKPDSLVIVDGEPLEVDLSFLPPNVWAIQTYGESAEVEYTDAPNSTKVPEEWVTQAIAAWNHVKEVAETKQAYEAETWLNSWERVRAERDALLSTSEYLWKIEQRRHDEQKRLIELGESVNLYRTPEWMAAAESEVLLYHQKLRDVPQDFSSPTDVIWPDVPHWIVIIKEGDVNGNS